VSGQSTWLTYGTVTWIGWHTLSGLAPGTSYNVRVYAIGAGGSGLPSGSLTLSTLAAAAAAAQPPGPVPYVGAGAPATSTTLSISFPAPYSGGAVSSYVILYRKTGQSTWLTYGTVSWIGWQTLTGLSPGTSYDVEVYAENSAGSGAPSPVYTASTPAQ
jgi:hypothetical protein